MHELEYYCDTCEIGIKRGCPHARGCHYNPWGEGISPPEYCQNEQRDDGEDLPF